jgi:hypothetical protein
MSEEKGYFGYVPATTRLDWGKMTGDIADELTKGYQSRELAKQKLDEIKEQNDLLVSSTEKLKTADIDDTILRSADAAREQSLKWNKQLKAGQISPRDYKAKMNAMKNDWIKFSNSLKGIDGVIQEGLKRQQPDETGKTVGSELELFRRQNLAEIKNLKNQVTTWDPNTGHMYLGTVDETGVYDPTTLKSINTISNPQNYFDDRFDLIEGVDPLKKAVATYTKTEVANGNTVTRKSARLNDRLKPSIDNFIGGVLRIPSVASSVLADNSGTDYRYYRGEGQKEELMNEFYNELLERYKGSQKYSEDQINAKVDVFSKKKTKGKRPTQIQIDQYRDSLIEQRKGAPDEETKKQLMQEAEDRLIKVSEVDGVEQPQLTERQMQAAERIIEDMILVGLPESESITPVKTTRGRSGGVGSRTSKAKAKEGGYSLYQETIEGWSNLTTGSNPDKLNLMLAKNKMFIEMENGKPILYANEGAKKIDGSTVGIEKLRIGAVGKAKELAPYVGFAYGTASKTGTWADEWEIQKRLYEQAQQNTNKPKSGSKPTGGSNTGKSKPDFSRPPR